MTNLFQVWRGRHASLPSLRRLRPAALVANVQNEMAPLTRGGRTTPEQIQSRHPSSKMQTASIRWQSRRFTTRASRCSRKRTHHLILRGWGSSFDRGDSPTSVAILSVREQRRTMRVSCEYRCLRRRCW